MIQNQMIQIGLEKEDIEVLLQDLRRRKHEALLKADEVLSAALNELNSEGDASSKTQKAYQVLHEYNNQIEEIQTKIDSLHRSLLILAEQRKF